VRFSPVEHASLVAYFLAIRNHRLGVGFRDDGLDAN
jgi:hypothetical protein